MFAFSAPRRSRRPSLTPMIDVVFLLLVFFMLAARFGTEQALPFALAGNGPAYSGPPRLVDVRPDEVLLNGVAVEQGALAAKLLPLVSRPEDPVLIRPADETDVQRVLDVMGVLKAGGLSGAVLVE